MVAFNTTGQFIAEDRILWVSGRLQEARSRQETKVGNGKEKSDFQIFQKLPGLTTIFYLQIYM